MPRRVAVILAVQNVPGHTPLPGALQGARDMVAWATADGWEVTAFTDDNGQPLSHRDISRHIDKLVQARDVAQMLLYFAGHGQCWGLGADFWLLSGNRSPGDVVDVSKTVELARQSGIPDIFLVADACRTVGTANDAAIRLIAAPLFPGQVNTLTQSRVDQFHATMPTQAALEVQHRIAEGLSNAAATGAVNAAAVQAHGVFTKHLVDALCGRDDRAKHRLPDGRVIVRPAELADALRHAVPRSGGALPGGFAQRPDCRDESTQILAVVQAAARKQLRIEAVLQDDSPAQGAELELLRHDPNDPQLFVSQRRIRSWSTSENLATGNVYGVRATLTDHRQEPDSPEPLTLLMSDKQVRVKLVPLRSPVGPMRAPLESLLTADPADPLYGLSVHTSYLELDDGSRAPVAPADGVFTVVTVDGVTGEQVRQPRFLRAGESPAVAAVGDEAVQRAVASAAALPSRGHFETETGLSISGLSEVTVYDPSGETVAFVEDGVLQVRAARGSAPLVLGLGQNRYAALARFEGFIGRVKVGPLGVENLYYLPSSGSVMEARTSDRLSPERFLRQAQAALAIAEAAARHGRFGLAVDEARPIARVLREYKHYNPILGVFAAYAYHQAGDVAAIRDMVDYYNQFPQAVPFDVLLLARLDASAAVAGVAPAYPLLTQGWLELDAHLHAALAAARASMAPTLWVNIVGDAGRRLGEAIKNGEIR